MWIILDSPCGISFCEYIEDFDTFFYPYLFTCIDDSSGHQLSAVRMISVAEDIFMAYFSTSKLEQLLDSAVHCFVPSHYNHGSSVLEIREEEIYSLSLWPLRNIRYLQNTV